MRRTIIAVLLTVGLSAWGQSTHLIGWNSTGNDLVSTCGNTADVISASQCYGYIQGALNGFEAGSLWHWRSSSKADAIDYNLLCIPNGVTGDQTRKVIMLYADKHPERLQIPAANLIALAVNDACGISSKDHACAVR
jgi:hypothetical protein